MEEDQVEDLALFDVHSHLHDDTYAIEAHLSTASSPHHFGNDSDKRCTERVCLCSVCPREWQMVDLLARAYPLNVNACFGVHPWNVCEVRIEDEKWKTQLKQYLMDCPNSILGEVGLDKVWKEKLTHTNTFQTGKQQPIFEFQFHLAVQLNKPMNIHCVQAHGWLFDFFRKVSEDKTKTFPPILLHSFSGSVDMMNGLIRLPRIGEKLYFSFSEVINLTRPSKKLNACILAVPEDKLLIESDWNACGMQRNSVLNILNYICSLRNWNIKDAAKMTYNNARRFLREDEE